MRQALHQLVTDVARVQVGEDQAVRMPCHLAVGSLRGAHGRHHGRVGLQLAIKRQLGGKFARDGRGLGNFGLVIVFRGSVRGMRQHGHYRLGADEVLPRPRGVHGNVGKLLGVGLNLQAAVAEQERAVLAVFAVRHHHDEEAADQLHARGGLQDLQAGAQHVAGCVARAGNHAVGTAGLHHHDAEVQHVLHRFGGLFRGHALVLAQLVERVGELGGKLGRARVDQLRAFEVAPRCLDALDVAQDDEVRHILRQDSLGGFKRARVVAFCQHDGLLVGFCASDHGFQKRGHARFLSSRCGAAIYRRCRAFRRKCPNVTVEFYPQCPMLVRRDAARPVKWLAEQINGVRRDARSCGATRLALPSFACESNGPVGPNP